MPEQSPALEVRDLEFSYPRDDGDAPFSLSLPHLSLRSGEQVLLTASSGTGKSTLLNLIAGLIDPGSGVVRVAGQDVHALRGAARDAFRGRHIGMIFQTFNLLQGFTAIENVMAALMFSDVPPSQHASRAAELLTSLGLDRHHRPADRLSVGQQQRVAVARAIACEPSIVLADEPTASLDPENAAGAISLIQQACRARGAALLCVSHEPQMRSRFERTESLSASKRTEVAR